MASSNKSKKLCAYCCQNPATEKEHVVAKQFFSKPYTGIQFITVPTCADCNRGIWQGGEMGIDKDEEYTRCLMTLEWYAGHHLAARRLWDEEIPRSIKKNPALYPTVIRNLQRHPFFTPSGLQLPDISSVTVDWGRFRRVLEKIVRGLFYHETKNCLPTSHKVVVEILSMIGEGAGQSPKLQDPNIQFLINETKQTGKRRLGDGVFGYAFHQDNIDPASTLWVISFYDGAYFLVATRPLEDGEDPAIGPPLQFVPIEAKTDEQVKDGK